MCEKDGLTKTDCHTNNRRCTSFLGGTAGTAE